MGSKNKMEKDGCYDLDGKCVNCGKYHPCDCEIENKFLGSADEDEYESDEDWLRKYPSYKDYEKSEEKKESYKDEDKD